MKESVPSCFEMQSTHHRIFFDNGTCLYIIHLIRIGISQCGVYELVIAMSVHVIGTERKKKMWKDKVFDFLQSTWKINMKKIAFGNKDHTID